MNFSNQYIHFFSAISLALLLACQAPSIDSIDQKQDIIYQVHVVSPRLNERPRPAQGTGILKASDKLYLTSPIQGRIDQVYVEEGDQINIGDPLCLFDSRVLNGELKVKTAELKESESFLDAYQRELNSETIDDLDNNEDILFLDEETNNENSNREENRLPSNPPAKKVQNLNEETLRSRITAYENKIERINQEIILIEENLKLLTITAPISGKILKRHITDGSSVREESPLFDIITVNPMTFEFDINQSHSSYIDKLVDLTISPKDAPDITTKGSIYYISPTINAAAQTISIKAHIPNEKSLFHHNQQAIAKMITRRMDKVLVIPQEAVVQDIEDQYIYIVTKSMSYKTPITILNTLPETNEVEIDANIRIDDLIITTGLESLSHQAKVRIIKQNSTPGEDQI